MTASASFCAVLPRMASPSRTSAPGQAAAIFRYTSTIGLREVMTERCVLRRESGEVQTPFGPVRVKRVSGWGVAREKYEYDDLARIAKEQGLSIAQVREQIKA